MTASPGPMPRVANATCRAAVHELRAKAAGAPTAAANSASNRFTFGPVVIQSDRRVSITSAISSSPMLGGENGKKLLRILIPHVRPMRVQINSLRNVDQVASFSVTPGSLLSQPLGSAPGENSRFLEQAHIVRAQWPNHRQYVVKRGRDAPHDPSQWRRECDSPEYDRAAGKQPSDLRSSDSAHSRIARAVIGQIIPKKSSLRCQGPENFVCNRLLHRITHHGRK